MNVMPAPWVELDGVRLYCRADRLDTGTTILDKPSITWGRTHATARRGTTTARFQLWDSGAWVDRAGSNYAPWKDSPVLGVPVVLGWTADDDTTRVIFRGTVSNFDMSRTRKPVSDHSTEHGWLIDVTATEVVTDLGTVKVDPEIETWPAESAILRANRLLDEIRLNAGIDIDEVYFEPDTVNWPMGLTKVKDKTILQLLDDFYGSYGLSWDYRPDENVTRPAPMRPFNIKTGRDLYRLPGTNEHVLASPPETLTGFGEDTATYNSTALRGSHVSADGPMTVDRADRINTIRMTYLRADGSKWGTTGTWGGITEPRIRDVDTWLNLDGNDHSGRITDHMWNQIASSNVPAMPTVTLDTRYTDGFTGTDQAFTLTRCSQSWALVSIMCNPYAAALGGPLSEFHIIGGQVSYRDGRWIIDMTPAWNPSANYAITSWEQFAANDVWSSLTWDDPNAPRLDESVTWADMSRISQNQSTPAQELT